MHRKTDPVARLEVLRHVRYDRDNAMDGCVDDYQLGAHQNVIVSGKAVKQRCNFGRHLP